MYKVGDKIYPYFNSSWDWGIIVDIQSGNPVMKWLPGTQFETKDPMPYSTWFIDKYYYVQPLQKLC